MSGDKNGESKVDVWRERRSGDERRSGEQDMRCERCGVPELKCNTDAVNVRKGRAWV